MNEEWKPVENYEDLYTEDVLKHTVSFGNLKNKY